MLQVNSDWFQSGTPQELEDYIGDGRFKYLGPGLYLTNNQTVLVVANEETDPHCFRRLRDSAICVK